jgi:ABC-2 type transport system ATP-binding protein/lipopolysaccharide transport system ATP-binding protein
LEIRDVSKKFVIRHNRSDSLKSKFVGLFHERWRERREDFWALRGIDLNVQPGEAVGLMGPNGSGKSTLLRLMARTIHPTWGEVIVRGRVAPIIEIGVGFHYELTGRENVYLSSSLYGLTRGEIDRIYSSIVEFSELGEFMDVPAKNYSSGMYARLGFSIAVHLDPDILLIDEALAVGDAHFQQKCQKRMMEFRRRGKTIVLVSHSADAIRMLCDRACLLEHGAIVYSGRVNEVAEAYDARQLTL